MPKKNIKEGILKGMYKYRSSKMKSTKKAHLMGSGAILNEAIKAADILESDYGVTADVWSVTSYKELHLDAIEIERWNKMNPEKEVKTPYISKITEGEKGVFIAASDYIQIMGDAISKWIPGNFHALGTYGFGRSETRESLRDFFEVDAKHIAYSAIFELVKEGSLKVDMLKKAQKDLGINQNKMNPLNS